MKLPGSPNFKSFWRVWNAYVFNINEKPINYNDVEDGRIPEVSEKQATIATLSCWYKKVEAEETATVQTDVVVESWKKMDNTANLNKTALNPFEA